MDHGIQSVIIISVSISIRRSHAFKLFSVDLTLCPNFVRHLHSCRLKTRLSSATKILITTWYYCLNWIQTPYHGNNLLQQIGHGIVCRDPYNDWILKRRWVILAAIGRLPTWNCVPWFVNEYYVFMSLLIQDERESSMSNGSAKMLTMIFFLKIYRKGGL